MTEKTASVFTTVDEVLNHFSERAASAEELVTQYRRQIEEFTGHNPNSPITALDVIKIVKKVFYK